VTALAIKAVADMREKRTVSTEKRGIRPAEGLYLRRLVVYSNFTKR